MADGAGSAIQDTHDRMCTELAAMRARRDALYAEYEVLVQDCDVLEQAVEAMQRWADGSKRWIRNTPAIETLPPVDFDGCGNTYQRLVRMAETWGGLVNCHHAADLLIDKGLSKSSHDNLVSTLQKDIAAQMGMWEHAGRRTYRYLPYRAPDTSTANGPVERGPE